MIFEGLSRNNIHDYVEWFEDCGLGNDIAYEILCCVIMAREQHANVKRDIQLAASLREFSHIARHVYMAHQMRLAAAALEP